jgi:hypothetical protein
MLLNKAKRSAEESNQKSQYNLDVELELKHNLRHYGITEQRAHCVQIFLVTSPRNTHATHANYGN